MCNVPYFDCAMCDDPFPHSSIEVSMDIPIGIKKLNDNAKLPAKATKGAAGYDLYCSETTIVEAGNIRLVPTAIALAIPPGYEGQVRSRSGLSSRGYIVANSPGTIDSDYRGEIGVLIHNVSKEMKVFETGDRIAQLVIAKVPYVDFVEKGFLPTTERGGGGFGSTG